MLDEKPTIYTILGGFLAIFAVYLIQFKKTKREIREMIRER